MNREQASDIRTAVKPFRWFDPLLRTAKNIAKIALITQACVILFLIVWLIFFAVLSSFVDLGGPYDPKPEEVISDLGLDVRCGTTVTSLDNHGGFLGDGLTFISVVFPDDYADAVMSDGTFANTEKWSPLPLTRELSVLAYGDETQNKCPSIVAENLGEALIPEIKNGYYCFIDRYNISDEKTGDKNILERYSQNFTLVIYDSDTHTLYYAELDT